jgi:hypothetical protein
MDVDETQKIDDLSVIDQIKSKNGHESINDQVCSLKLFLIL